jgi:RNA polymerase sigma factor (sigma-70 family)
MLKAASDETKAMRDCELVEAAQAGAEWAFTELCARNSPRLFRRLYQITQSREDAEDALQNATLSAFLNLKGFDGRSSFSTWFHSIGVNCALMILRKKRMRPEVSLQHGEHDGVNWIEWDFPAHEKNPEEQYANEQTASRLRGAISRLPESYRSVMKMRGTFDSSIEEISQAVGISKAATKARLCRARSILQSSLNRERGKHGYR